MARLLDRGCELHCISQRPSLATEERVRTGCFIFSIVRCSHKPVSADKADQSIRRGLANEYIAQVVPQPRNLSTYTRKFLKEKERDVEEVLLFFFSPTIIARARHCLPSSMCGVAPLIPQTLTCSITDGGLSLCTWSTIKMCGVHISIRIR